MINKEVTQFLDSTNHPLRKEIEALRIIILEAYPGMAENIKWNAPNYNIEGKDRITMKIFPPKQIQLIFHRGAKVLEMPETRLIPDPLNFFTWKTNDRAFVSYRHISDISSQAADLKNHIQNWIKAS